MMKKITTLLFTSFLVISGSAQQIGDGLAAPYLLDFSGLLKSGVYGGYAQTLGKVPDVSADWNHLFVVRHANPDNNFQLQIASSFAENDRLFFRKIAGDLTPKNPNWVELATRGTNTFTGDQTIVGKVGIGTSDLTSALSIGYNHGVILSIGNYTWANKAIIETGWHSQMGDFTDLKVAGYGNNDAYIRIVRGGNVGIGTSTPDAKLAVNGTIHSKEVKVDLEGWNWPDYVFKKEYKLPTLEDVEKHINEKGHLENIPSEEEALKNGINLGEMNAKLLQKIEELTLYMIEMKKDNLEIKKENVQMKSKQSELENTIKELTNKIK